MTNLNRIITVLIIVSFLIFSLTCAGSFKKLVDEYVQLKNEIEYPNLMDLTVAQWALESGWGTSSLAKEHNNFGGLSYTQKLSKYGPPTTKAGRQWHTFKSERDFILGYWKFIDHGPYGDWRRHTSSDEAYLRHIVRKGYCPDNGYVESVLKILPQAKDILEAAGAGKDIDLSQKTVDFTPSPYSPSVKIDAPVQEPIDLPTLQEIPDDYSVKELRQSNLNCPSFSANNMGQYISQYKSQLEKFEKYYSQFNSHLEIIREELEKQKKKCNKMKETVTYIDYSNCDSKLAAIAKLAKGEKISDKTMKTVSPEEKKKEEKKEEITLNPAEIDSLTSPAQVKGFISKYFGSGYERDVELLTRLLHVERGCSSTWDPEKGAILQVAINRVRSNKWANSIEAMFGRGSNNGKSWFGRPSGKITDSSRGINGNNMGCTRSVLKFLACTGAENRGASMIGLRDHFVHRKTQTGQGKKVPSWNYINPIKVQPSSGAAHFSGKNTGQVPCQNRLYKGANANFNPNIKLPEAKTDDLEEFLAKDITPSVCDDSAKNICLNEKNTVCLDEDEEREKIQYKNSNELTPKDLCSLCVEVACNKGKACQKVNWKRVDYSTDGVKDRFDSDTRKSDKACIEEKKDSSDSCKNIKKDKEIGIYQCYDKNNPDATPYCDIFSVKGKNIDVNPPIVKQCHKIIADLIDACVLEHNKEKHGVTYYLDRINFAIDVYKNKISPKVNEAKSALSQMSSTFSNGAATGSTSSAQQAQIQKLQSIGNSFSEESVGQFQLVTTELIKLFRDTKFQADIRKDGKGKEYDVCKYEMSMSENTKAGSDYKWEKICTTLNGPEAAKSWYDSIEKRDTSKTDTTNTDRPLESTEKTTDISDEQLRLNLEQKPEEFLNYIKKMHKRLKDSTEYAQNVISKQISGCSFNAGKCALKENKGSSSEPKNSCPGEKEKVKDRNLDQWSEKGISYAREMGKQSPQKLFVRECQLRYQVSSETTPPNQNTPDNPSDQQQQDQNQPSVTPSSTSPSPGEENDDDDKKTDPDPSPSYDPDYTPTVDPDYTPTPTYDPDYTPTPTIDPSVSPSPSPDPSATPTPSPTATPSPTISVTPKPSKDCEEGCQTCVGSRESHCHAHKGVCVCEESADIWSSIDKECNEKEALDEDAVLKCCLLLFELEKIPNNIARPEKEPQMCEYEPVKSFALSIDYCQSKTSDTGLCCSYAFDEKPISNNCLKDHKTGIDDDGDGKIDEDPVDGIDNDGDGKIDEDGTTFTGEIKDDKGIDQLAVSFSAKRNGVTNDIFFAGDNDVKFETIVKNEGDSAFSGTITIYLDTIKDCGCPECPKDTICACKCDAEEELIFDQVIDYLLPGDEKTFVSEKISIPESSANATLQTRAIISDNKENTRDWKSKLYYVIPKGNTAITDAYFINEKENRILKTYPFQKVQGIITASLKYFPVEISVYVIKNDVSLDSTLNTVKITKQSDEIELKTKEYDVSKEDMDAIFHIGVKIKSENGTILLDEKLSEQPMTDPLCRGVIVTHWCETQKASFRMSYPAAFLSVENPLLNIHDVLFINSNGTYLDSTKMKNEDLAKAEITMYNGETMAFSGEITITSTYKEDDLLDFSEKKETITLETNEKTSVETELLLFSRQKPLKLQVHAADSNDIVWYDEYIDEIFMPDIINFKSYSSEIKKDNRGNILTEIEFGTCRKRITCLACLPTCEIYVDEYNCEITPTKCDCMCDGEEIESIYGDEFLEEDV